MTIETVDDLADPNNVAAAYMKLQDDVKRLILDTVRMELQKNPWGALSMEIRNMALTHVQSEAKHVMDREMQNYRIVYRGTTSSY